MASPPTSPQAIDQAVADGVDVINYSIGGGANLVTADTISFLFAADAGVFSAVSAGNDGPAPATIGGPADVPWVTAVGANSQRRFFEGTIKLDNGKEIKGASLTRGTDKLPIVDAEFAGTSDLCLRRHARSRQGCRQDRAVPPWWQRSCRQEPLGLQRRWQGHDPLQRQRRRQPVQRQLLGADGARRPHRGPARSRTTSLTPVGRRAQIKAENKVTTIDYAPSMTIFSSRGPNPTAADIIKPDITAPGLQVMAGASPFTDAGFRAR